MVESIWMNEITLPAYSALDRNIKTDVLIIGGGLAGILCAYFLKQAGVDCILIEADKICHGVTRNTTAKITSQHGLIYNKIADKFDLNTARLYWEANQKALLMYRKLSEQFDCDFEVKDNYIYSRDSLSEIESELKVLNQIKVPAEFVKTSPLLFPIAGAVKFSEQAQFHPIKFISQILKNLTIYENTSAQIFDGESVVTEKGKITASKIIVTTHFPIFNKHGSYFLKLYQQRSYVIAVKNAQHLDGMYLDPSSDGFSFRNYGDLLLIGGGGHRTGKQGDGWSKLLSFSSANYPDSEVVGKWATQDCMSLDGIPYIGVYSRSTPNLFVATGFNKWGMTSSMVSAMILTDLVQERENVYASVFSPTRTMLRQQLFLNALESSYNLLMPTKPRCPHLGCALKWNSQEHSWDCPCHGSRFSETGKLLDNPANGDLNQ